MGDNVSFKQWIVPVTVVLAILIAARMALPGSEGSGAGQLVGLLVLSLAVGALVVAIQGGLARLARIEAEQRRTHAESTTVAEIETLSELAQQSRALPEAAASLAGVRESLLSLESVWTSAHQKATTEMVGVLRDAMQELRVELKGAVEESARVTRQAIEPIFEDAKGRWQSSATEHAAIVREAFDRDLEQRTAAEAIRSEQQQAMADALVASLSTQAEAMRAREAELAARIGEHAESLVRLEETSERRASALLERLSDAADALRDSGSEQLSALAGQTELAETRIARIEAENARLLEDFLEAARGGLDAHAERLGGQLDGIGTAVDEAAALVKAGGAEMSGVAEMFGQAVDRQQAAANAWLESLGEIESAVERAGRGAAVESLRGQLAASEEVFTRQLDFQRELFEQLRALRGSPVASSSSDDDEAPADV